MSRPAGRTAGRHRVTAFHVSAWWGVGIRAFHSFIYSFIHPYSLLFSSLLVSSLLFSSLLFHPCSLLFSSLSSVFCSLLLSALLAGVGFCLFAVGGRCGALRWLTPAARWRRFVLCCRCSVFWEWLYPKHLAVLLRLLETWSVACGRDGGLGLELNGVNYTGCTLLCACLCVVCVLCV